jgi:hypothetical protein
MTNEYNNLKEKSRKEADSLKQVIKDREVEIMLLKP